MSYAHNTDATWVISWEADLLFKDFEKSNAVPKISLTYGVNHPGSESLVLVDSSFLAFPIPCQFFLLNCH